MSFRNKLGLEDPETIVKFLSSYNFHPEENFKLDFWRATIVENLPRLYPEEPWKFSKFTASDFRIFWKDVVLPGSSLIGLNNILAALVNENSLWRASDVRKKSQELFQQNSYTKNLFNLISSSLFAPASVSDSEVLIARRPFISLAQKIAAEMAEHHATPDVVLMTESEILERLPRHPSLAPKDVLDLIFVAASEAMAGVCFEVNKTRAVKISFLTGRRERVTQEDESRVIQRLALAKLETMETQLERKITAADTKCREHLRESRKSLAMNALKERKMYEAKIFEIHALKMKIAESHSLTQTAIIQQFVVDTMSASLAASKMLNLPTQAEQVQEDMTKMAENMTGVNESLAAAGGVVFDDKELENEFEKLRKEAREANLIVLPQVPASSISQPQLFRS